MKEKSFRHAQRVIIVMYPHNLEEFQEAVAGGYHVSTSPEQRHAWGLAPDDQLPTIPADRAMELLFAEPGDPILDQYDPDMRPAPWGEDGEMRQLADRFRDARAQAATDGDNIEARIPNVFTLQVPRSMVTPKDSAEQPSA